MVVVNTPGTLLQDKVRIRKRWAGFQHKLLNTKSLNLDPTIVDLLPPRPLELSLGDEPSMDEMMTEALKGMSHWQAVGPDGFPAELLKIDHPAFAQCFHNILANVWEPGEVPQQWKYAIIKVLHEKEDRIHRNNYRGISLGPHEGNSLSRIVESRLSNCCKTGGLLPKEQQCGFRPARSTTDM